MKQFITIYTDGACSGNPGNGAWSCIVYNNNTRTITDAFVGSENEYLEGHLYTRDNTTNNRMELMGLLKALELATTKYINNTCLIYCDSSYVVNIFNEWIYDWAANNWINSSKQEVKNLDLIKPLYEYAIKEFPNYRLYKITGHNNIIGNELADAYATAHKSGNTEKLTKIIKENEITLVIE